jgi:cytochrome c biogenesis protein CcdA
MALTFAAVATLAAIGGGWAVQANEFGRFAALALLALLGLTLLFPALSDRLTRPLVALGSRLSETADRHAGTDGSAVLPSLLLGVATRLLSAPCAGPVLGLIPTGAALQGANAQTSLLLAAYASGAATSLALALLIGGRVFAAMKRSLGPGEWIRRGLGVAILAGVVVIGLGFDTKVLSQISLASSAPLEQGLIDKLHPAVREQPSEKGGPISMTGNAPTMTQAQPGVRAEDLPIEGEMPSLSGAAEWLNSPPLTPEALRGKVVVVDFWDLLLHQLSALDTLCPGLG